MNISVLYQNIASEMNRVDEELKRLVAVEHPVMTEAASHLLMAGGKRLRPAFVLMGGQFFPNPKANLVPLAAAIELVHMASLVHDDVIDCSATRRGVPTVKARWGNRISMQTGDYLFAKALILISGYQDVRIVRILADVSVKMVEGEIQQLLTAYDTQQSVKDYLDRIRRKTALLISTSFQLGAIANGAPEESVKALVRYGYYLGMAFQITDDILDLTSTEEVLGKAVGSDLTQGILTLPVIYALREERGSALKELIERLQGGEAVIQEALQEVYQSSGIERARGFVERYIAKAQRELEKLPDRPAKRTLGSLAEFINVREY
ncbi:MAG: heptaprenyl diphosphate synthase [Firmicutes bacterium]|nr:heptaprenyl diphosphate synthase [Bacillota bacterium]